MAKVIVAMSGGVDSSVSAYLMKEAGHEVIGLYMKNWQDKDQESSSACSAQIDAEDVARVCNHLQIPHYTVNFTNEYQTLVFAHFLKEYQEGFTPNPDILCNREIKFKVLWEKAKSLGADYLATGHYCQNRLLENKPSLFKGSDSNKDQSYFLYTINQEVLSHVLFPIGHLTKPEVREIAKKMNLSTYNKKDSTGICFIGKRDFKEFLSQYVAIRPGAIVDLETHKEVGSHQGVAFYTIGQRKGLYIGGQGEAWFVVAKEIKSNTLFVVQGENHPALLAPELLANEFSWINELPDRWPLRCEAKIRYRHPGSPCLVHLVDDKLHVVFDEPQRSITPRQSIVFYDEQRCLGGAMIFKPLKGLASSLF
jgi:tRNA-specific 2-thiouridylase